MSNLQKIKLLVVDDSAFMRKLISDFFSDHRHIEVIGAARNGKDAIKKIEQLEPDVVTMDVEMTEMNGMEALKEIMQKHPLPVIMLSSTTKRGAENTLMAMEYGAVDFVAKPSGSISLDLHKIKNELVHKVEEASKVTVSKLRKTFHKSTAASQMPHQPLNNEESKLKNMTKPIVKIDVPIKKTDWSKTSKKLILIGTSTGGPRALQEVITKIPANV